MAASRRSRRSERLDPGDELDERERLRDVVVAACVEAGHAVDDRVARGEEEHRRLDAARAERLADVAPVGVGQADVDDEDVRHVGLGACEHLASGRDAVDGEALLAQAAAEDAPELCVVLDDEHTAAGHRDASSLSHASLGSAAAARERLGGTVRPTPPPPAADACTRGACTRLRIAPMLARAV